MLLARRTRMATLAPPVTNRGRTLELRIPITHATELSFGLTVRRPYRNSRIGWRNALRRWCIAATNSLLLTVTIGTPAIIVVASSELEQIGHALLTRAASSPAPVSSVVATAERRSFMHARRLLTTETSAEPPYVRAYVVQPGDTLLSLSARFGIAPQTLAYNNSIADSAALRAGQSLVVPPFDAALHVLAHGESVEQVASRYGLEASDVRELNRVAADDSDATEGRMLVLPVPDAQFPGFRLRLSEAPRVLAPRMRWPVAGVITQLFNGAHTGVDIAAPYGTPIVAPDAGTVTAVGWRGPGGLGVCVLHDFGLETCAYHAATVDVEVGERVAAGQTLGSIGMTGITTGPHVHWETRTNGALVDPLTYVASSAAPRVGTPAR